jgi:flagellar FliJ protein
MKRFHFSLRPLAVLRAHRESVARAAFGQAVQALVRAGEELAAAGVRVVQLEAALAAGRQGSFRAAMEVPVLAAHARECSAEAEASRARDAARLVMEQRRAAHLDAHRGLEVLRRLEEKARTSHRLAANREEQAGFDEFATRRSLLAGPLPGRRPGIQNPALR